MEEVLVIKNKKFSIVSTKAIHEEHTTYIATWSGRTYLIRVFNFGFDKAMADYKVLKHAGINMAKICFHDDDAKIIVFDYFPEEDCLTALYKAPLADIYFQSLFALYRFARFSKVALDWEPQNFMLRGSQMFYLPTKWAPLDETNALEKGGLRNWFRGKEGFAIMRKKNLDVQGMQMLNDAEVNKELISKTLQFWD